MAGIMIQDSESLDLYLRDISSSEPLSGTEEIGLASRIRKGDQNARDKLVGANLRFVVSETWKTKVGGRSSKEELVLTAGCKESPSEFCQDSSKRMSRLMGFTTVIIN